MCATERLGIELKEGGQELRNALSNIFTHQSLKRVEASEDHVRVSR